MESFDRNIETERLSLRVPTMDEQYGLWLILRQERVNKWYMPTPKRFKGDRAAFQESLNHWDDMERFYRMKVDDIESEGNKYTWSIFLKDSKEVIGQMTVQPHPDYPNNLKIRDVGWFINPDYQGCGYAYEAATAILDFMFEKTDIVEIKTSAAQINVGSWKLMEKLGFERVGEKESTYLDDEGENLAGYCYEITKEKYLAHKDVKKL
ncbi:MAG: GNAT family N-acetyltransferase [Bacilli bacterium]|nr:GNAT family N-acetyltransferase [Bacilli bacterium]